MNIALIVHFTHPTLVDLTRGKGGWCSVKQVRGGKKQRTELKEKPPEATPPHTHNRHWEKEKVGWGGWGRRRLHLCWVLTFRERQDPVFPHPKNTCSGYKEWESSVFKERRRVQSVCVCFKYFIVSGGPRPPPHVLSPLLFNVPASWLVGLTVISLILWMWFSIP